MGTKESPTRTCSVEEFEWNLKLILTIVSREGIQLDTISDTYKKYFNENIDPSMLQANSKHWTTIFQALPLLCKTFELFEHHEFSCIYVKIRPFENSSENINEDVFIKKVFLLANYKKALLLSNDDKCYTSESDSMPELEIINLHEETDSESDNSYSESSPNSSDESSEEEEEDGPTAAKRKRTNCKSPTHGTLDPTNAWKVQLNPDFTIIYKTASKHYHRPPEWTTPRRCPFPTYPPGKMKSFLFSYKFKEKERKYLCTQDFPNDYSCVIASGDTVYEIGGTKYARNCVWDEGRPALSTVKIYKSRKEIKGPNLTQPTMNASACIVNDSLYLIGGNHLKLKLNTLQRLNLKQVDQGWNLLKPMSKKRSDFGIAVVGSSIYAIGGDGYVKGKNISLKSGEVYNTEKNSWENIPDMTFARRNLNTCALNNNLIYAISNTETGYGANCTMEEYNCELKTWKSVADLLPKHCIYRQVAVPSNNLIFLMGKAEMTENAESSNFMEVYDPRINQWNTLPYKHYFKIRPDAEFITHLTN